MRHSSLFQRCDQLRFGVAPGKPHQPADRDGQGRVELQPLRHVAEAQARLRPDCSDIRLHEAEDQLEQCRLSPTIRPDHGEDLARGERKVYAGQDGAPGAVDGNALQADQRLLRIRNRQDFGTGLQLVEHTGPSSS
jgi:hypothetical protein